MSKQNIYDNDLFYENFEKIRSKEINFNDIIETPIILGMIPELYKKKVLDIGCGMGQHALQYSKKGALSVLGIDISEKMLCRSSILTNCCQIFYIKHWNTDYVELEIAEVLLPSFCKLCFPFDPFPPTDQQRQYNNLKKRSSTPLLCSDAPHKILLYCS